MLLLFNTKGPTGLGIDITGTAADTWVSYVATYEVASSIEQLNTKKILRAITLDESRDFTAHITLLQNKLFYARSVGAEISKKNFIAIIFNSLPLFWDLVIANVFEHKLSSVVIVKL